MSNIGNSEPYPSDQFLVDQFLVDQFLVDQFHFTPTEACIQNVTLSSGKTICLAEILEAGQLLAEVWKVEDEAQPEEEVV